MQPATAPATSTSERHFRRFNVWGVFLVLLGVCWLLEELGIVEMHGGWIAPLAVMTAGAGLLLGHGRPGRN